MEDIKYTLLTLLGFFIFAGFWVGFLYLIARFFGERYDKKPLKYIEVKKDIKINHIKNMENQNQEEVKTQEQQSKWNKLSIAGFVLSIISIFGLGLAGLIGFILGIVALTQIKHTKERGKGLAITAIVVGAIWSFGTGILKQLIEAGY